MSELIIDTKGLNFSYDKKQSSIENLNLKVPTSSIYGFLGANGSGKTTTIRLLLGLLKKQSGDVKIFGESFSKNRIKALHKIGSLIENPSLYGHMTAKENLKIIANYRGGISEKRINEVLDIVRLSDVNKKKVKNFSLGMKQRLGMAIAILNNPELVILDEPTNGLDPKGIIEMRELIKNLNEKYGTTIFISSHLLSEIEKICSHIGVIKNGELLFQDTIEVLKKSQKGRVKFEIETNNFDLSIKIANKLGLTFLEQNKNAIRYSIINKKSISNYINELCNNGVEIYQVKIEDNIESLFLSLTENEN